MRGEIQAGAQGRPTLRLAKSLFYSLIAADSFFFCSLSVARRPVGLPCRRINILSGLKEFGTSTLGLNYR